MAGAVMRCPYCDAQLWDKDTRKTHCKYCNAKIKDLSKDERMEILEMKVRKLEENGRRKGLL